LHDLITVFLWCLFIGGALHEFCRDKGRKSPAAYRRERAFRHAANDAQRFAELPPARKTFDVEKRSRKILARTEGRSILGHRGRGFQSTINIYETGTPPKITHAEIFPPRGQSPSRSRVTPDRNVICPRRDNARPICKHPFDSYRYRRVRACSSRFAARSLYLCDGPLFENDVGLYFGDYQLQRGLDFDRDVVLVPVPRPEDDKLRFRHRELLPAEIIRPISDPPRLQMIESPSIATFTRRFA
jgi:hypothetical protein